MSFLNDHDYFTLKARSFLEFKQMLEAHEMATATRFVYHYGGKKFTQKNIMPKPEQKVYWSGDTPYFCMGYRMYVCHQGPDINKYQKKKYADRRDEKERTDLILTKRYNIAQPSKKQDCPAKISVKRIFTMPNYRIPSVTECHQKSKARAIKEKLSTEGTIEGEEMFMFQLPAEHEHKNHSFGVAARASEEPDPKVRKKIKELVQSGEENADRITDMLAEFVTNELGGKFYPNRLTVRTLVASAKRELKIDVENTAILVKNLTAKNVYFRPCTDVSTSEEAFQIDENEDNDDLHLMQWSQTLKHHMLLIFQSNDMSRLYRKYGGNSIFLDATYKTCKYTIPLYFLVVKTNVNYQVVAVIVSQLKTKEALIEGLTIIRNWNPDVIPKYGLADNTAEEISALEIVFPNIRVFISAFHREQAWTRWSSQRQVKHIPKDVLLNKLRLIANATSEENVKDAISELRSSKMYSGIVESYIERRWIPELQRWALAYKPVDLLFDINGVECLSKDLSYHYLEQCRQSPLSKMIDIVLSQLIPEKYLIYIEENVRMMPTFCKYAEDVPPYLHNRPKWFIEHVMSVLSAVVTEGIVDVDVVNQDTFIVASVTDAQKQFLVTIDPADQVCSCTCDDFGLTRLVCKHCVCVGLKFPAWSLEKISEWAFSIPTFMCDEDIVVIQPYKNEENDIVEETVQLAPFSPEVQNIQIKNDKLHNVTDIICYDDMHPEQSRKNNIIASCNMHIRSLQSAMKLLPEPDLKKLEVDLGALYQTVSSLVSVEDDGILVEEEETPKISSKRSHGCLQLNPAKKKRNLKDYS